MNINIQNPYPRNLENNKISSFQKIKSKIMIVESKASKIEQNLSNKNMSNNLLQDIDQISSMYVDAIKAKAALISQL